MGLKSQKILGISVTTSPKKEVLEEIEKYLNRNSKLKTQNSKFELKPLMIVTPNPEQIVLAQEDRHFAKIINRADVALPDGIGISLAAKFLNAKCQMPNAKSNLQRIPGVEFMEDLIAIAADRGYPIGLIGGRAGVAAETLECLQARNPGLRGWAMDPGELEIGNLGDLGNLRDKIRKTNTRLVFVGLGAPKQEYFIEKLNVESLKLKVAVPLALMSVGGAFDIISGRMPRAPHAIQAIHLEWLWRLVRQPWRWRRQVALLKFLWLVTHES